MRLLFITGGSRWKIDNIGNYYNDSTFNSDVWNRYLEHCEELTVLLRRDNEIYAPDEAKKMFNYVPDGIRIVDLPDIYKPTINYLNFMMRKSIINSIHNEIDRADAVIIRSLCNIYTNTALRYCKKTKKRYLVEVTGFELDALWYHSIKGKIVAPFNELKYKLYMRDVYYAIYVTRNALQKRYPSAGDNYGCSDVEIYEHDESILVKRIERTYRNHNIIIGTAAFVGVKWKKQENVVKALYNLRKKGHTRFRYQIVGGGNDKRLRELIDKYKMSDYITMVGVLNHNDMNEWLDSIDIYVQPSYMEGLCRSIAEAMGRACPVICSDVGGNGELISSRYMYPKRRIKILEKLILEFENPDVRKRAAIENFEKISEYLSCNLDKDRSLYMREFLNG